MTYLTSNTTDKILSESRDFNSVWYNLIQRIGLPVGTNGQKLDSIEAVKRQIEESPNNLTCVTQDTENYRTNKQWFTIRIK